MKEGFKKWDILEHLQTEEDIKLYWEACLVEADDCPQLIIAALNDISRARNMQQLAKDAGVSRQGLYQALSGSGNPSFINVMNVIHALGLRITPQMNQSNA